MAASTIVSLLGLVALLGVVSAALYDEDIDYGLPSEDEEPSAEKRFYMSTSCRHCLHFSGDYLACIQCYSRPGSPTPYFGIKKRAGTGPAPLVPDLYEYDLHAAYKRSSFLACKCCLSLGRSSCCNRCGFRQQGKRGYMTSFVGLGRMSSCRCCEPDMFNFSCCIRCRK